MAKKASNKIAGMSPFSSKEAAANERKWRAEEDLRTLRRAIEIRNDKERMAAVKALAKEQLAALQSDAEALKK